MILLFTTNISSPKNNSEKSYLKQLLLGSQIISSTFFVTIIEQVERDEVDNNDDEILLQILELPLIVE